MNATKLMIWVLAGTIGGCAVAHYLSKVSFRAMEYVSNDPSFPLFIGAHLVVAAPLILIAAVVFDLSERR